MSQPSRGLPECVVVFGASGFVGRNLVQRLAHERVRVIGVSKTGSRVPGSWQDVAFDRLDEISALSADTVAVNVAAHRYEAASLASTQTDVLLNNSTIAARVYAFCVARDIREVRLASSVAVYPAELQLLDDETRIDLNAAPHTGEALYAWSKRWAEICADLHRSRFAIHTITFRLSNPYGPYDSLDPARAHVLPAFVIRALSAEPTFEISGDPRAERDFVYVDDVVDVFVRSLQRREQHDFYNLAAGETTVIEALARKVLAASNVSKPIMVRENVNTSVIARRPTSSKLMRAFGLDAFRDLDSGLRPTIIWYRDALRSAAAE